MVLFNDEDRHDIFSFSLYLNSFTGMGAFFINDI